MRSYCVKQRRQTECVPGSESISTTKNGRTMMRCKCAECGITKTKFVKSGTAVVGRGRKRGKGLLLGKNSPFKGIPLIGAIL